ncbi:MAG: quinone-interacting membrane-bound oxidoreductase complex subunit QmoC [Planctomycetota bacterium]
MTGETPEQASPSEREIESRASPRVAPVHSAAADAPVGRDSVWVEPDLDFIRTLRRQGGNTLKKCIQCGTCSATCDISPDAAPFPRKEMAWAGWGMKDRLLADPDIWLCYQCNDCSTRCPRGARPGDVLGAVRQACVRHYAIPRFLGRWVSQPHCIPLLLGIPAALLTLALAVRDPIEKALGISRQAGKSIVYAYSSLFPHWLLNTFFAFFSVLAILAIVGGIASFWRAMKAAAPHDRIARPAKALLPSIAATLKSIVTHDKFALCTKSRPRQVSHLCVFYGFAALTLVTIWVITARYNPLIQGDFIYPFGFWNPWKVLANLGGLSLVVGCLLMIYDRLRGGKQADGGSYFDWSLLAILLLVAITGFITEVLHYLRLEPHRHIAYFMHLTFVLVVLMHLPYSKLAHLAYRGAAMVFAEHIGREGERKPSSTEETRVQDREREDENDAGEPTAKP